MTRERISETLIKRSGTLTALQQAPGEKARLPLQRSDFESWAQHYCDSSAAQCSSSGLAWAGCIQRLYVTDFLADTDALRAAAAQLGKHLLALAESESLQLALMTLPAQLQLEVCRQLHMRTTTDYLLQSLPSWCLPTLTQALCSSDAGGKALQLRVPIVTVASRTRRALCNAARTERWAQLKANASGAAEQVSMARARHAHWQPWSTRSRPARPGSQR